MFSLQSNIYASVSTYHVQKKNSREKYYDYSWKNKAAHKKVNVGKR